jgi:hypothetical protein
MEYESVTQKVYYYQYYGMLNKFNMRVFRDT